MGLRLVNMFPRTPSDYVKPGQPLLLGLRSDGIAASPAGSVVLGTFQAAMGYTSVQNGGLLPESSIVLPKIGASVSLDSAERVRPAGPEILRIPFGTGIKLTTTGTVNPTGVYAVQVPIDPAASVMGYFKFKTNSTWTLGTHDWCDLFNMTGIYLGVEYGPANTMCWASLRGSPAGVGSLVVGGPLQTFGSPRPGQRQIPFTWGSLPNGSVVEVWIVFNLAGYAAPFTPANVPVVEVWTKAPMDSVPVLRTSASPLLLSALGTFPSSSSHFDNSRPGASDQATLYFGNASPGSDSFELLDWALFPDYRVAVRNGEAFGPTKLTIRSDSPYLYKCADGRPTKLAPGRWFFLPGDGFHPPIDYLYYAPTKATPSYLVVEKSFGSGAGYYREEPRLFRMEDGAVIEAFLSVESIAKVADSVGAGISIDDGHRLFQLAFLETDSRRTLGLFNGVPGGSLVDGYFTPSAGDDQFLDWRSLKLVRLVVDRLRGRVSLFVDGVRYLDRPLTDFPGSTSNAGRMSFGHLESSASQAKLNVSFLSYLTRYVAWELDEHLLPEAAPAAMTWRVFGAATKALSPDFSSLLITKPDVGTIGSRGFYSKLVPTFDERHGLQLDFKMKVVGYADSHGTAFAKMTWVGTGVQIYLGNKVLHLGCFDCGSSGRVVGIVPGSGSTEDIINQTPLGRAFSSQVDWTEATLFRVSYRPYDRVEVWVDNIPSGPVISIPWLNDTDGFDLPQDTTPPSVAFGHFDGATSSVSAWEFFRYGVGNGYEVAIEPLFPDGLKEYFFGGRTLLHTEFDE
jgi:hypothetical protein